MPKYLLTLIFLLSCLITYGQSTTAQSHYNKGKELYDQSKYEDAITSFAAAIAASDDYQDAIYYLGLCYRYINKYQEAIGQFTKLEQLNPDYWAWYHYEVGTAHQALGQFDESIVAFNKFLSKFPNDPSRTIYHHQAMYKRLYSEGKKELMELAPTMKEAVPLPDYVNSAFNDYMPSNDPTGKILYFTSTRKGGIDQETDADKEGDEDIYKIEMGPDGKWSAPILLPQPINSGNNEGASTFAADGQMVVYTACGRDGGIGGCDLYILTLEGDTWSDPKNLGSVVNSKAWDSQPTISSDGSRIIFASERDGGYGSSDLYMIEKNRFGDWGPPMNLGGAINTPFSEGSPYLSPDGKTLYFASTGHPGYGGYDLFKTVYENGKWSTPVNMGRPLNTEGDDRYFTIGGSGEVGYYATDKGTGIKNLYQIEIPEEMRPTPTVVVSGIVTNAKTKEKVGAYVLVEDIQTGELIAASKSNSTTGKYLVVLPAGRNYSVSANKEAFFFYSQKFDVPVTAKYQEINKDIELQPIEKGAKVVLNNIFFETGKATLSPESRLELDKAVDLMKQNPSMVVEVGGHTDNVGDDAYNMRLSHDRARAVRDYLVNASIRAERVQAKGYGEANPIATNETEEGRKANRRTEFIILEF